MCYPAHLTRGLSYARDCKACPARRNERLTIGARARAGADELEALRGRAGRRRTRIASMSVPGLVLVAHVALDGIFNGKWLE